MNPKARVVVIYFGGAQFRSCRLALAVAEGAWDAGAEVRVRCVHCLVPSDGMRLTPEWSELLRETDDVPAATADDLTWADATIFGTATGRNAGPRDETVAPSGPELMAARDEGRRLADTIEALKAGVPSLAVVA
jgi:NAD(P)H dehydrogenase (quinone)